MERYRGKQSGEGGQASDMHGMGSIGCGDVPNGTWRLAESRGRDMGEAGLVGSPNEVQ